MEATVETIEAALHELLLAIETNDAKRSAEYASGERKLEPLEVINMLTFKPSILDKSEVIIRDPVGQACRMAIRELGVGLAELMPDSGDRNELADRVCDRKSCSLGLSRRHPQQALGRHRRLVRLSGMWAAVCGRAHGSRD